MRHQIDWIDLIIGVKKWLSRAYNTLGNHNEEATMTRKTEGVQLFAQDVLRSDFSEPCGEDIIRDVWLAIEGNREWQRRYDELSDELSHHVVNQRIGRYVKAETGLDSIRSVDIESGHIVTSYTKLGHRRKH